MRCSVSKLTLCVLAFSLSACAAHEGESESQTIAVARSAVIGGPATCSDGAPVGTTGCFPHLKKVLLLTGGEFAGCTATWLRPGWALTAAHCTGEGSPTGDDVSNDDLRVHLRNFDDPREPWYDYGLSAQVTTLYWNGNLRGDWTLLRLDPTESKVLEDEIAEVTPPITPVNAFDPAIYQQLMVNGLGFYHSDQTPNREHRYGWMVMDDPFVMGTGQHVIDLDTSRLQARSEGSEALSFGDSGSATFGMATWPYGVVGVTSTGCSPAFVDACYRTLDKTVPYIWIARSVDFADFANATMNQQIPPRLVYFASASDRDLFQQVNVTGTPAWSISGGAFLQSAESTEGFQMLADYYESVTAMVSLMAQDDDHSGMVFRYVDPDNYYLVSIRDQTNNFRIIKRKEGKDILLGQQKWVGSAVDWHQIHLTAKGDRFTALLRAGKQGGGGILTSLTVRDSEFPVGKVGLYQSSNRNASFDEFFVFSSNLPPDTQPVAQHDPNVAPRDPNVSYEQIGLLTEAWTQWFDTDDAGGTGDYEAISSIENRGHYVCGGVTPVSMQARIVGQTELMASRNEVFRMEP
ncbi:MAG TPA: trypsin-like serine protease, partial [Polyangiaceae bacterium]|nr:trypsin-like serine protease [Polyangiaceae bacterium]